MKTISEFLCNNGFLFSDFRKIQLDKLGTKKHIDIFSSCDIHGHFISVFVVKQKNRFILKDAIALNDLKEKLSALEGHKFKSNILIIKNDICSKSTKNLNENNWKIYNDFM